MSADDDLFCASSLHGADSAEFEFVPHRPHARTQSSYHITGHHGGRSMHSSTSLQVCYVNDVAADLDRDTAPATTTTTASTAGQRPHPKPDVIPKSVSEVIKWTWRLQLP